MQATTYKEIIFFCRSLYFNKQDAIHVVELTDTDMAIFKADEAFNKTTEILRYTYECDNIKNFFKDLLMGSDATLSSTPASFTVFSNVNNHYQFLVNYLVLDLILTAEMLKHKGQVLNREFKLKTKNKVRDIIAPADELKIILQDINKVLQRTYDKRNETFQVAYKSGKCIKDNAAPHLKHKYVFKIDLHDFFPSCKREYVEKYIQFLFKNSINSAFVKEKFLEIILHNDALFIGSPISGTLANAIISKPVFYIKNICNQFNMEFTVYADDMTFSSDKFIYKDFIIDMFNRAFMRYNMENDFSLNEKKCYGVSECHRSVTGVVINHKNELTCHRHVYQDIRQTLHQLSYDDTSHLNYNKLKGQIAFMSMLDESGKLKTLLTKYKNTVLKYKLVSQDKLTEMGV